jgi:hypothetical protein
MKEKNTDLKPKGWKNLTVEASVKSDFKKPRRKALLSDHSRQTHDFDKTIYGSLKNTVKQSNFFPRTLGNPDVVLGVDLRHKRDHDNPVAAAMDQTFVPNTRLQTLRKPIQVPANYLAKLTDLEPIRKKIANETKKFSRMEATLGPRLDLKFALPNNDTKIRNMNVLLKDSISHIERISAEPKSTRGKSANLNREFRIKSAGTRVAEETRAGDITRRLSASATRRESNGSPEIRPEGSVPLRRVSIGGRRGSQSQNGPNTDESREDDTFDQVAVNLPSADQDQWNNKSISYMLHIWQEAEGIDVEPIISQIRDKPQVLPLKQLETDILEEDGSDLSSDLHFPLPANAALLSPFYGGKKSTTTRTSMMKAAVKKATMVNKMSSFAQVEPATVKKPSFDLNMYAGDSSEGTSAPGSDLDEQGDMPNINNGQSRASSLSQKDSQGITSYQRENASRRSTRFERDVTQNASRKNTSYDCEGSVNDDVQSSVDDHVRRMSHSTSNFYEHAQNLRQKRSAIAQRIRNSVHDSDSEGYDVDVLKRRLSKAHNAHNTPDPPFAEAEKEYESKEAVNADSTAGVLSHDTFSLLKRFSRGASDDFLQLHQFREDQESLVRKTILGTGEEEPLLDLFRAETLAGNVIKRSKNEKPAVFKHLNRPGTMHNVINSLLDESEGKPLDFDAKFASDDLESSKFKLSIPNPDIKALQDDPEFRPAIVHNEEIELDPGHEHFGAARPSREATTFVVESLRAVFGKDLIVPPTVYTSKLSTSRHHMMPCCSSRLS